MWTLRSFTLIGVMAVACATDGLPCGETCETFAPREPSARITLDLSVTSTQADFGAAKAKLLGALERDDYVVDYVWGDDDPSHEFLILSTDSRTVLHLCERTDVARLALPSCETDD